MVIYDILNPNDSFYNDIWTPYSSKSNTDMILYDRKIYEHNEIFKSLLEDIRKIDSNLYEEINNTKIEFERENA